MNDTPEPAKALISFDAASSATSPLLCLLVFAMGRFLSVVMRVSGGNHHAASVDKPCRFFSLVVAAIVACTSGEPTAPVAINGLARAPNAAKGHEAQCDMILITAPTINIPVGGTVQLTANPYNKNAKPLDKVTVTWSSFDIAIAVVNSSGLVTGVSTGSAIIHAQSSATPGTGDIQINVQ